MPLQPLFSNLQHTHPRARAISLHLFSNINSSWFIFLSLFELAARFSVIVAHPATVFRPGIGTVLTIAQEWLAFVIEIIHVQLTAATLSTRPARSCVRTHFSYFALHHFSLFNWFVISFNSLLMSSSNDQITSSAQNSTAPPAVIKISIVIALLVLRIRFVRRLSCAAL